MKNFYIVAYICLILSCISHVSAQEVKALQTNQVQVSKQLLQIIQDSKKHFEKRHKTSPKYIKVEFFNGGKYGNINIDNMNYLYIDEDEQDILNEKFIGGFQIGNAYILIKDNNLAYNNQQYKILSDKLNIEIIYGGNLDISFNRYEIIGRKLNLKDSFYGFDVYVD